MSERHAVVLAGGLGTRARELTGGSIPKAMLEVAGKPFLQLKLESLIRMGFTSVTLLVGELGSHIESFVNTTELQLNIKVIFDGEKLLGTAGSIKHSIEYLPDQFWVTFGDSLVSTDIDAAEEFARNHGCSRIMTVLHNKDEFQVSNTTVSLGIVTAYEKKCAPGSHEWIDYGLLLFEKEDFLKLENNQIADLGSVICSLIARGELCGYEVHERFWDVGDPIGFQHTIQHFELKQESS